MSCGGLVVSETISKFVRNADCLNDSLLNTLDAHPVLLIAVCGQVMLVNVGPRTLRDTVGTATAFRPLPSIGSSVCRHWCVPPIASLAPPVPVNMAHTGVELPLSVEVKSALFSVANNALTNMPQNRPPPSTCRVPAPATAGLWLSGRGRIPPASSLLHCNGDGGAVDQLHSISRTDTPVRRATRVRLQGDDDLGC